MIGLLSVIFFFARSLGHLVLAMICLSFSLWCFHLFSVSYELIGRDFPFAGGPLLTVCLFTLPLSLPPPPPSSFFLSPPPLLLPLSSPSPPSFCPLPGCVMALQFRYQRAKLYRDVAMGHSHRMTISQGKKLVLL